MARASVTYQTGTTIIADQIIVISRKYTQYIKICFESNDQGALTKCAIDTKQIFRIKSIRQYTTMRYASNIFLIKWWRRIDKIRYKYEYFVLNWQDTMAKCVIFQQYVGSIFFIDKWYMTQLIRTAKIRPIMKMLYF